MIDANMRYTVERAIKAAQAFKQFDVFWFEEPTIPDDYAGMARIAQGRRHTAGGRGKPAYDLRIPAYASQLGQVAFPEPDVSNIGGITNWMRVAKLAYAHNSAGHVSRRSRAAFALAGGDSKRLVPRGA